MKRWPTKPLGEVAIVQMGQSPPGETYNTDRKGLPFFQGKAEFGEEYPAVAKWCTQPSRIAEAGDILLSVRAPVGPTNFATERCCIGRGLAAIRAKSNQCAQRYIRYYLKRFETDIALRGVGSTFSAINRNDIERLQLPVPPLDQQHHIVRLLDEADELRKLREQADRRTDDLIPSLFHEMFGEPSLNAKNFPVKLLPEVAFFQEGPGVRKWQFRSSGIKLINVGNIVEGQIDLSRTERHLDKDEVETTYRHFLLNAGELVMATSGATWGKVAVVEAHHLPLCMNTSVVRFRPLKPGSCLSEFLRGFLESKAFRQQIEKLITGSAQPNFGPSHLKQIRLPIPPLTLQNEFAARVTDIRATEAQQAASRRRLDDLFQSMLHRAFCGEL